MRIPCALTIAGSDSGGGVRFKLMSNSFDHRSLGNRTKTSFSRDLSSFVSFMNTLLSLTSLPRRGLKCIEDLAMEVDLWG